MASAHDPVYNCHYCDVPGTGHVLGRSAEIIDGAVKVIEYHADCRKKALEEQSVSPLR